jgi:hypothetical protein
VAVEPRAVETDRDRDVAPPDGLVEIVDPWRGGPRAGRSGADDDQRDDRDDGGSNGGRETRHARRIR